MSAKDGLSYKGKKVFIRKEFDSFYLVSFAKNSGKFKIDK